jgi:hypothetical protein
VSKASKTEELALVLVQRLYEVTDGAPKQVRMVTNGALAKNALEFAVDNGWVSVDGESDVSLTDQGRDIARKAFS